MKNQVRFFLGFIICTMIFAGSVGQVFAEAKGPMDFVNAATAKITEVTPQQVKADLDAGKPIILVDVRDSEEFEAGHLPKALNISRGLLEWKIGVMIPDKNASIVMYCRTGARSALTTARLQEMGYTNVRNMQGAFKAWGEAGYPIYNRHGEFVMQAFEKKL